MCVCVCLHLLVAECVSAGGAGLLVQVLLGIQDLLRSVLVLMCLGVFGPHTATHSPSQLCAHTHTKELGFVGYKGLGVNSGSWVGGVRRSLG